jgi:hypothetical protein
MEPISIEFITEDNKPADVWLGWLIRQGDKYADGLCYDEMLGLLAAMTMPNERQALSWLRTKEQHLQRRRDNLTIDHS